MATGGTGDDEVVQEGWIAIEDDEVGKETGTGNQEDTREHQDSTVQVQNQNKGGGYTSWISSSVTWALKPLLKRSRPVSQCKYIGGDPSVTDFKVIYDKVIAGSTEAHYELKFHDPPYIITGISCLPIDTKTSSPEADVIGGGVGCKEVEIVLTPVQKGEWCCCVRIIGKTENTPEMNSGPDALTM